MLKTLIEMKGLFLFMLLFLAISCKEQKLKVERPTEFKEIEFKLEGFEWDKKPYKFKSYITDSVLQSKGHQVASWDYSYICDIENMHKAWDSRARARKKPSQEEIDSFALFERYNAIEYILKKAEGHQVVILNEGHHMPQHRVFTTQLLDGLKKQGFKHLGLETYFNNPKADSLLEAEGYPILRSGYYTKEPQFGNLVRAAHSKGFKIFGYESEGHENGKEREINQAKNIQEYIEKHPDEKVLIHCGFDHGYEGIMSNSWGKAMAGRLTEFTEIDPSTR